MKIISYGNITPKRKDCRCCGAVFEYLPRDIETHRAGTHYAKTFVRCPVCGNVLWIDEMLIKHDKYLTFQVPDRRYKISEKVDGRFVSNINSEFYTFRVIVDVGFDGPPLGDSILDMIKNCVHSYVKNVLPDIFNEQDQSNLTKIEKTAADITNVALSKLTTRVSITNVQFVAVCPTQNINPVIGDQNE